MFIKESEPTGAKRSDEGLVTFVFMIVWIVGRLLRKVNCSSWSNFSGYHCVLFASKASLEVKCASWPFLIISAAISFVIGFCCLAMSSSLSRFYMRVAMKLLFVCSL